MFLTLVGLILQKKIPGIQGIFPEFREPDAIPGNISGNRATKKAAHEDGRLRGALMPGRMPLVTSKTVRCTALP